MSDIDVSDLELDIVIASAVTVYQKKCRSRKRKKRLHINNYLRERGTKGRHQKDVSYMLQQVISYRLFS